MITVSRWHSRCHCRSHSCSLTTVMAGEAAAAVTTVTAGEAGMPRLQDILIVHTTTNKIQLLQLDTHMQFCVDALSGFYFSSIHAHTHTRRSREWWWRQRWPRRQGGGRVDKAAASSSSFFTFFRIELYSHLGRQLMKALHPG